MLNAQAHANPSHAGALADEALKDKTGFPDIETLRISLDEFMQGAVKELLVTVPVGKSKKSDFFRVNPSRDYMLATMTYECKDERKHFLVAPDMVPELVGEATPTLLLTMINRQNVVGLWPLKLGSTDWALSASSGRTGQRKMGKNGSGYVTWSVPNLRSSR